MIGRENSTGPFCQIAAIPPLRPPEYLLPFCILDLSSPPRPRPNVAPEGAVSLPATMALDSNSAIYARWRNSTLIACSPRHTSLSPKIAGMATPHPPRCLIRPVLPSPSLHHHRPRRGRAGGSTGRSRTRDGIHRGGGGSRPTWGPSRRAVNSISPTYTSTPDERNRCVETLLRTAIESGYVTEVALSALPCADNGNRYPPESRGYHLTPGNLSSILFRGKLEMKEGRDLLKDWYGSSLLFQPVIRGKKSTALFVCERYLTQDPNRVQQKPSK